MKTTITRYVPLALGAGALAALMAAGPGAAAQDPSLSRSDIRFIREAAQGGRAEVQLGELAVRRASSDRVRRFAQRMIDDHSRANDDLTALADRKDVSLPSGIGAEHRAVYDRLARLHGSAFDAAYIRAMRMDHQEDVSAFRTEANAGRDPDVRHFASSKLPTLREHYRMVSDLAANRWRMGRM